MGKKETVAIKQILKARDRAVYENFSKNPPPTLKKLLTANKDKISSTFHFVKDCVSYAANMRENSSIIDYIDLGFGIKEVYDNHYKNRSPSNYFYNKDWQYAFHISLLEYIVNLIKELRLTSIREVGSFESIKAYIATLDSTEIGWVNRNEEISCMFVKTGQKNNAFKELEKLFWLKNSEKKLIVSLEDDKLTILEDLTSNNFIMSPKCLEYGKYIQKFQNGGLSRSFIFYGPPGSGKSNLIKGICNFLNVKSLRFKNLSKNLPNIDNNFITELIKISNCDAIILEDLDHCPSDGLDDLLNKFENFNNETKLVFATANQISKLDNALLRPGRFDEAIEIKTLEEEIILKLVEGDVELLERVRHFPVAFTSELMKRIKILGKEQALQSIKDLTDRLSNFENINYELKTKTSN